MTTQPFTVQEINLFDQEQFVAALGKLFEGTPWIVEQSWSARPFTTRTELYNTLCTTLFHAPGEQQLALLQAHPDLVGRAALAGTLTPASTSEQASAGLDRLSPAEIATFTHLNQAYQERFGFPFIICVRENRKASILASFSERMHHSRPQEINTALNEVTKICRLRLADLVPDEA